MKKVISVLLIMTLVFSILVGCSGNQTTTQPNDTKQEEQKGDQKAENVAKGQVITILSGGTSGVYFPLGNMLAKIYTEKLGAQSSSQTTAASSENSAKIAQKKAEVAFVMADTAADAYLGQGKYKDSGALSNLRAISALYGNYMQLVATTKSGISSLQDLKGKKVAVGAPGSGTEIMASRILKAAGLSYDDINEDFLSFSEGIDGVKNGTVDAVFLSSGLPNAGIMELATTHEIVLIPIEGNIVTEIQKEFPAFTEDAIPAGTYKGQDKAVPTANVKNLLITHADVSDELVYELTKAFYENLQSLREAHNAANGIILENATKGLPLPLHPGAEKYYKEVGVLK